MTATKTIAVTGAAAITLEALKLAETLLEQGEGPRQLACRLVAEVRTATRRRNRTCSYWKHRV